MTNEERDAIEMLKKEGGCYAVFAWNDYMDYMKYINGIIEDIRITVRSVDDNEVALKFLDILKSACTETRGFMQKRL